MARRTRRQIFIDTLNDLGGKSSNPTLQTQLGWSQDVYWNVHTELFEEGIIERGKGYGGTAILVTQTDDPIALQTETPEKDLYKPVEAQLAKHWHLRHRLDACLVENVAQQGSRETGGNWSRPDLALVALKTFEYLPDRIMEIHTFEVKPAYDISVKGVMEALTHREFSTRAYVIYHTGESQLSDYPEADRIEKLATRHGIGVIAATNINDLNSWQTLVQAVRSQPDPEQMELFIKRSLSDATKSKILKWLK